jgi:hypothetical protein
VWTEKKGAKIDNLYNELEESPVIFKKYLNKLLRDDPINNLYLLTQHLDQLNKKFDRNNYEDEHLLQHTSQYRDLVSEMLLEDSLWNSIKSNFPLLNLEMINEFWYYFNKSENELKGYIRKILSYPVNYKTLVQYRDSMRNYQVFFTKDYNKIDKETDEKITELVELITKLLNTWYDEIPPTRSDNPTLYNVE